MATGSSLISKILSPALRLWLRSQVQGVESLQVDIQGQDRQILKGYVPRVSLSAEQAVYQGLRLGRALLRGENIRINIGQVIKGKPLQLLEPIQVAGEVRLSEEDLQASLASELLQNALGELLTALLEQEGANLRSYPVRWQSVTLGERTFHLGGTFLDLENTPQSLRLQGVLSLLNSKTLRLEQVKIQGLPHLAELPVDQLTVDLGEDVEIETLSLTGRELSCLGRLLIRP
ncbi:MAG: DUF2993 domain-containing protein [Cyanobacteriota bacterium]|nr:DUF2993 domain-containing protein [Cyanobacteriota bacterium]